MAYASVFCAAVLASAACHAATGSAPTDQMRSELVPQGTLRVAIAVGASPTAFRAVRDRSTGQPQGVTVALANALAQRLGVALQLVPFESSAALTNAAAAGAWDVAFVPADVERAKVLDFTPPYYLYETAFLARPGSRLRTVAQVDRPGVRIAALASSTTLHAVARELKQATVVPVGAESELLEALRSGKSDVVAMGRESLRGFAARLPGSRILEGEFHAAGVAAAVPKNHPAALAYLRDFIEEEKASGAVQKALDTAGVTSGTLAPPVAAQ
jgi:polar amino acid transport system substrate-binding protein